MLSGESRVAAVRPKKLYRNFPNNVALLYRNFPNNVALKMSRQQDEQGVVLTAYTSNTEAVLKAKEEQTDFLGAR